MASTFSPAIAVYTLILLQVVSANFIADEMLNL